MLGEDSIRSNSGTDEARNNLRDPTVGGRELEREIERKQQTRTTEMGSDARNSGQKGADG